MREPPGEAAVSAASRPQFRYDYRVLQERAAAAGRPFDWRLAETIDRHFAVADLTQAQVDAIFRVYVWVNDTYLRPSNFPLRARLKYAVALIFPRLLR